MVAAKTSMEKSAGIILYRERLGSREYLLLRYPSRTEYWGFTKGHLEGAETEEEAALREAREETNLISISIIPGFQAAMRYFLTAGEKRVSKEVVFFLGEVDDVTDGSVSGEHQELRWFSYEVALNLLKHKKDRKLLEQAEEFVGKLVASKSQ